MKRPRHPHDLLVALCALVCLAAGLWVAGCNNQLGQDTVASTSPRPCRILLMAAPFAQALERIEAELENTISCDLEFELATYDEVRRIILQNRRDRESHYDLIAFDSLWLGEFIQQNILRPLTASALPPEHAFFPGALRTCIVDGSLYGAPFQPAAEVLWVRRDFLEKDHLPFPQTPDDLLRLAKRYHRPEEGRYGIAWNAQRGVPLGQSMAHFYTAFGGSIVNADGRPTIDTPTGHAAAAFAMALLEYSHPDILNMAWDQRIGRFAGGETAMAYGWTSRAALAEANPVSRVAGLVRYGPAPVAPGVDPAIPLDVWALGIPANARHPDRALSLLTHLLKTDVQKELTLRGNATPALRVLLDDPEIRTRFPATSLLATPEITGALQLDLPGPMPEWNQLCTLLGNRFHDMLMHQTEPDDALRLAQRDADALFPPVSPP